MVAGEALSRVRTLSDGELLTSLTGLLRANRRTVAEVVAHLGEVEERRLHLIGGYSSLFAYCIARLGMSEDEAGRRIKVARLVRRCPPLLEALASGQLSLSVAVLLEPHLVSDGPAALIAAVSGKTIAQAREVLAAWYPQPDVLPIIRRLPEPRERSRTQPAASSRSPETAMSTPRDSRDSRDSAVPSSLETNASAADTTGAEWVPAEPADAETADAEVRSAEALGSETLSAKTLGADRMFVDPIGGRPVTDVVVNVSDAAKPASPSPPAHADAASAATGQPPLGAPSSKRQLTPAPPHGAAQHPVAGSAPVQLQPGCLPPAGVLAASQRIASHRITPLSPERYRVQLTASGELKRKLELARDLLRHAHPSGDLAVIIERGLDLLIERTLKRRFAVLDRPDRPLPMQSLRHTDEANPRDDPPAPRDNPKANAPRGSTRGPRQHRSPGESPSSKSSPSTGSPKADTFGHGSTRADASAESALGEHAHPERTNSERSLDTSWPRAIKPHQLDDGEHAHPERTAGESALGQRSPRAIKPQQDDLARPYPDSGTGGGSPGKSARTQSSPGASTNARLFTGESPSHERALEDCEHPERIDSEPFPTERTPDRRSPGDGHPNGATAPPTAPRRSRSDESALGALPTRHRLPNAVRRTVLERDDIRCTWRAPDGTRCDSRAWLEHDHVIPRGQGGGDDATNIRIRCRAHNQLSAELAYGKLTIRRITRRRQERSRNHLAPKSTP